MNHSSKNYLSLFLRLSGKEGYWVVNKLLTRYFKSVEKAAFLSEIISKYNYFYKEGKLKYNKWFFLKYECIKESLFLSIKKQRRFVKELVDEGFISVRMMGSPAKQYYKINPYLIEKLNELSSNQNSEGNNQQDKGEKNNDENKDKTYPKGNVSDLPKKQGLYNNKEYNNNFSSSKYFLYKYKKYLSEEKAKIENFRSSSKSLSLFRHNKKLRKNRKRYESIKLRYGKEIESLLDYWNSLGKPLTRHKRGTSLYHRIGKVLTKIIQRYSSNQVKEAISRYHLLLTDSQSILSRKINAPGYKVGLDEFFGFTQRTKDRMRVNSVDLNIKSWFIECLREDVFRRYALFVDDLYPLITSRIRKLWADQVRLDSISPTEENIFRKASVKFKEFVDKNSLLISEVERRRPQSIVHYLFQAIDEDVKGDWSIVTPGWLLSQKTFNNRLPLYLQKIGVFDNSDQDEKDYQAQRQDSSGFSIYEG